MIMGAAIASVFWIAALPLIKRRYDTHGSGAHNSGAHNSDDRFE